MREPTERDMEILGELIGAADNFNNIIRPYIGREGYEHYALDAKGFAPLDFGGSNGSHHGATATKLVKYGYVEQRKRGYDWGNAPSRGYRGSKVYRPTKAGREAFAAWWSARP